MTILICRNSDKLLIPGYLGYRSIPGEGAEYGWRPQGAEEANGIKEEA
jgi:hypothetical protein